MSMTASPAATAARNMLVAGTGLLLAWSVLGLLFLAATPLNGRAALGGAFLALAAAVAATTLWFTARGLRARGQTLLDCGAHPMQPLGWIMAAGAVLLGAMSLMALVWSGPLAAGSPGAMVFVALCGVGFALGRLQVTEHGVWSYWGFVPWSRIEAWEPGQGTVILITRRSPGVRGLLESSSNLAHLSVPPQHRDAFTEHLERRGIPRAGRAS